MTTILVTGMSGTGKSTVLVELGRRGHRVVDTDTTHWSHWVTLPDGSLDWVWREPEMQALLTHPGSGHLFVSGCKTNQGEFYPLFDEIVLLSAPTTVLISRIEDRETNDYGKSPVERDLILEHMATVEPLLRRTATHEIDTTRSVDDVADQLQSIADSAHRD